GEAASHVGHGWETFTDAVIDRINEKEERCVFILWGANARTKKSRITQSHHIVIESAHPSPLSAHAGFFGSRPFSQANTALREVGKSVINWALPTDE
ncbi:MAG: uracil-DNA glycosylase, partial [Actinomycetota bacterium]